MAFTRKALKARAQVRKTGSADGDFLAIVKAGEAARLKGMSQSDNPYPAGSDDADAWDFGFQD